MTLPMQKPSPLSPSEDDSPARATFLGAWAFKEGVDMEANPYQAKELRAAWVSAYERMEHEAELGGLGGEP